MHPAPLPPGIHLQAQAGYVQAGQQKWASVRLLGDDGRGYLIVGFPVIPGGDDVEFWFATVEDAFGFARDHGIPDTAWNEILRLSEIRLN